MFKFFKSKLKKLSSRLSSIGFSIGNKIKNIFSKNKTDDALEELEKLLYESDLGVKAALELTEKVKEYIKENKNISSEDIINKLKEEICLILNDQNTKEEEFKTTPHVIMVVGTNGSGKTTSIAKLAKHYQDLGKSVLIIAADTYRVAAVEQLNLWANKLNINIVKSQKGSDPSAVVYDGISSAIAKNIDVVLIDTAGRLHTKTDLMQELEKIKRVSSKLLPTAPHETFLVIDATTGQNALDQAKIFNSFTPITNIILTKLDGSAKGGIVIAIYKELGLKVKWIGLGEAADDLISFDSKSFVDALLSIE